VTKFKIGILGPSEIAFRRFLPALSKSKHFAFAGVACANAEEWLGENSTNPPTNIFDILEAEKNKALKFQETLGGKLYTSYKELIQDPNVDAVYVPLPPLLHHKWGKFVLQNNKHLFLEKPFTTSEKDTKELNEIAKQKNLATHENFAFVFHNQITAIQEHLHKIGDIRLIRTCFGFPYRGSSDFRYSKNLGGGALLDCGGYPIKLAAYLLGENTTVAQSQLSKAKNHDVDVYGSATLTSKDCDYVAQISFGMDNSYKCELEVWGSEGVMYTPRVFTPTAEMETKIHITTNQPEVITVAPDDQFLHSLDFFGSCITDSNVRINNYKTINLQSKLMQQVKQGDTK
jgi:NDP-hexose-3-ketoreductase